MSGWDKDGFYGLTRTSSLRWARCGLSEARARLEKAGFIVHAGKGGNWIRIEGAKCFADFWPSLTGRPARREMYDYDARRDKMALRNRYAGFSRSLAPEGRGAARGSRAPSLMRRFATDEERDKRINASGGATDEAEKQDAKNSGQSLCDGVEGREYEKGGEG